MPTTRIASYVFSLLGASFVLLAVHGASYGAPARFWFSLSPTNPYVFSLTGPAGSEPGAPELKVNPFQTASVYLWAQPQTVDAGRLVEQAPGGLYTFAAGDDYHPTSNPFRQLVGVSFDLTADQGVQVTAVRLDNPRAESQTFQDYDARFQTVVDSLNQQQVVGESTTVYPNPVGNGLEGVLGVRYVRPVASAGADPDTVAPPTAGIGAMCTSLDGCFEGPNGPAWRLGEVRVQSFPQPTAGNVWLQVGASGMGHVGDFVDPDLLGPEPSTLEYVTLANFGGADGPIYNVYNRDHRQTSQPITEGVPQPQLDASDLQLSVVAPLEGDYNGDGVVDAADYTLARDLQGANRYLPNRGPDITGAIGPEYIWVWQANYGQAIGESEAFDGIRTPESSSLTLLALVMVGYAFRRHKATLARTCALVLLVSLWSGNACAVTDWISNSDGNWGASQNWSNGVPNITPFGPQQTARFQASDIALNLDVRLNGNRAANGLRQSQTGQTRIWSDDANLSSLTLGGEGIIVFADSGRLLLESDVILATSQEWDVRRQGSGDDLLLSDPSASWNPQLKLSGHTLTIKGGGDTRIQAQITGNSSSRIVKRDPSTLVLSNSNSSTFLGSIDVLRGTLEIAGDANLGAGGVSVNGADLFVNGSTTINNPLGFENGNGVANTVRIGANNVTLSGAIGGGGGWNKQGTGRLTLSGNNGFSGFLTVDGGTVLLTNDNSLNSGAILESGTTLWVSDSGTFDAELHSGSAGAGRFLKSGTGRLTLTKTTSANQFGSAFTGEFEIEGGQLAATPAQFNNRRIDTNRSTAEAVFLGGGAHSGVIAGSGRVIKENSGTLVLSGSNSYAATTVRGGVLQGTSASIRGTVTLESGADLSISGTSFPNSVVGTGDLFKTGSARLVLGGANNFAGTTNVVGGTLVGDTTSLQQPVSISAGAALELNTNSTGTRVFSHTISGAGNLVLDSASKFILSGPTTYSGTTTVKRGSLEIDTTNFRNYSTSDFSPIEFSGNVPTNLIIDQEADDVLYNSVVDAGGSGARGLIKRGSSVITLSGDMDFPGLLDIQAGGILGASSLSGAGTEARIGQGAFLGFTSSGNVDFSSRISGAGRLIVAKGPSNRVTLSGENTYAGGTLVETGILRGAASLGAIQGDVHLSDSNPLARLEFDDPGVGSHTGSITGAGNVRMTGGGRVSLSGSHSYSGWTLVSNGSLDFVDSNPPGDVTVETGGALVLSGDNRTSGAERIYSYNITGAGSFRKEGTSTLSLTGDNDYSGGTEVAGGVLSVDLTSLGSGDVALSGGGELWFTVTSGGSGEFSGSITGDGALRKTAGGAGVLKLTGSNSYSGGIDIEGGTVEGSTTSLSGAIRLHEATPGGPRTAVVFQQDEYGYTSGPVSGEGDLIKTGPGELVLNAPHSYSPGVLSLQQGSVSVRAGGLQTDAVLSSDTTLRLAATAGYPNQTYSYEISGSGGVEKYGSDIVTVEGVQTYTGSTTVTEGVLRVNGVIPGDALVASGASLGGSGTIGGSVSGPGRVAPGNSPGILTISGDYTMGSGSQLDIEIEGTATAGVDYDLLRVGGEVTLRGAINFDFTNNPSPSLGDNVTFLETFGAGEVLAVPMGSEPRINTTGLDPASNLAARVTSHVGPGGTVEVELVPATNVFFDGSSATTSWFTGVDWSSDAVPTELNNTYVGGNVFVQDGIPQRVVVDSATSTQTQQVRRLVVGDALQPVILEVETGINSVTGDISIEENGAVELDGGDLFVGSARTVNVTETGMLMGNGGVFGDLKVGVAAGSTDAMLSPSLSSPGSQIGTVTIDGDYTQGAGGVYEVDITGVGGAANQDFVNVTGSLTLDNPDTPEMDGGKLRIDLSGVADPASLVGEEYIIAEAGSIEGEFSQIEVVGAGNVYFRASYDDLAPAAATSSESIGLVQTKQLLKGIAYLKGDITGDAVIDSDDAKVLSALLIGGNRYLSIEGIIPTLPPDWFSSAFDFVRSPFETTSDSLIDFNDVPYFAAAMAASQGTSFAQAMSTFETAYQEAYLASIPEPNTAILGVISLAGAAWRRRG